jgi:hypothetical protein
VVVNQAQHPAVVSECLVGHGSKTKATFIEADECELPTPEGRSVLCCYLAFILERERFEHHGCHATSNAASRALIICHMASMSVHVLASITSLSKLQMSP